MRPIAAFVFCLVIATSLIAQQKVSSDAQTTNAIAKFDGVGAGTISDSVLFESSGFIGLGTITPANAFHIVIPNGSINVPLKLETSAADSITGLSLKNDARNWHVRVDGTDGDKFKIFDANVSLYRLTIDDAGNVGIGTTAPKARVHVHADPTGDQFIGIGPDPSGVTGSALNIGYGGFSFGRGGAFFNVRPDALATAPNPSLRFSTVNVERMIITNTGAIGIGTSAPTQKVHVLEATDTATTIEAQNTNNTGLNATAVMRTRADAAVTSFIAHGSGRTSPTRFGQVVGGWAELLTFGGNGLMIGTSHAAPLILGTSSNAAVRITPAGDVGVGTATPSAKMHVAGNMIVDGSITGSTVIGAVYQDLAEWVPASADMTPGTVVVLNIEKNNEVMPSARAYDTAVAGVVSAAPGIILGIRGDSKEQIATTGRVKVRVDARQAAVRVGDLLVTSDTAGTAMRSEPMSINGRSFHQPGTIIGKALEPLAGGVGEILVLLSMQ